MVRPQAATFLDEMLRDERHIRVEELAVPARLAGERLSALDLGALDALLVAIRNRTGWRFNPTSDHLLETGDTLIVMTSAAGRAALESLLSG